VGEVGDHGQPSGWRAACRATLSPSSWVRESRNTRSPRPGWPWSPSSSARSPIAPSGNTQDDDTRDPDGAAPGCPHPPHHRRRTPCHDRSGSGPAWVRIGPAQSATPVTRPPAVLPADAAARRRRARSAHNRQPRRTFLWLPGACCSYRVRRGATQFSLRGKRLVRSAYRPKGQGTRQLGNGRG